MDKRSLSERDICTKFITPALRGAGWDEITQIREEVSFTKGRIIVRGKMVSRGKGKRADYILSVKPNIPIAIIEAKGLVTRSGASNGSVPVAGKYKTISTVMAELDTGMTDRFEALQASLTALGDDVQETTLQYYIAFKRIKNFACVEFRPTTGKILVFLKVDPSTVTIEPGFMRDVSAVGHFGTGDLEVTLTSADDLERAMPLIERSYSAS